MTIYDQERKVQLALNVVPWHVRIRPRILGQKTIYRYRDGHWIVASRTLPEKHLSQAELNDHYIEHGSLYKYEGRLISMRGDLDETE